MIEMAPKYYIIKKDIIDQINSEQLQVSQAIPSERELMERYSVSRITIRKAIDDLVNEGYLYRIQGKGTYVKNDDYKQDLFSITSCTEDIRKMGMTVSKKLIDKQVIPADKVRIRRLQLTEGDNVLRLARIYYADQEPINFTITHLPCKIFPGIDKVDFSEASIYDIIENTYNIKITTATRTLEAVSIHDDVCQHLQMKKGDPVLLFRAITYGIVNGKEMPIETFKCYYRSDKFKFYINQVR